MTDTTISSSRSH